MALPDILTLSPKNEDRLFNRRQNVAAFFDPEYNSGKFWELGLTGAYAVGGVAGLIALSESHNLPLLTHLPDALRLDALGTGIATGVSLVLACMVGLGSVPALKNSKEDERYMKAALLPMAVTVGANLALPFALGWATRKVLQGAAVGGTMALNGAERVRGALTGKK